MTGENRFMTDQLSDAWGIFLAVYPWDWFVTLTFREPPGSFRAHRMFARFAREIEKAANAPIGWFRADEYGPTGGRLHMHALMLGYTNGTDGRDSRGFCRSIRPRVLHSTAASTLRNNLAITISARTFKHSGGLVQLFNPYCRTTLTHFPFRLPGG